MDQHLIKRNRFIHNIIVIIRKRCIDDIIGISKGIIISVIDHQLLTGAFKILKFCLYDIQRLFPVDDVRSLLIRMKLISQVS